MQQLLSPYITETPIDGTGMQIGIIVARFNSHITGAMLELAHTELTRLGVARESIKIVSVPGSYELATTAQAMLASKHFDALICFGCVMKGETRHDVLVGDAAAHGIQRVALDTGVPIIFGVICAETEQQARARIERGTECAHSAVELACTIRNLREVKTGALAHS
jgi:6,7-dimethyl-8-ribityllumazine synthase